ncbi:MAG: FCD domain-containing protein [Maricaulis sp.]|jgi:DNA-binding GntR family transcriptional regulator|nr:FCD domain-containing protein [Maricaulis sp.]
MRRKKTASQEADIINDPAPSAPATDALGGGLDSSDLRARLRDDTISGALLPGQRLRLEDLRSRYNASVGSLREALVQLASEGFVIAEANRGFCVAPVSLEDLEDITNTRVDLERKAVTLAIEHGDDRWEAGLVAAYHMLSKCDAADTSKASRRNWWERHNEFHEALVAACPSPWLLRFRETLFDHSHRYRSLAIQQSATPGRLDEHKKLMEAALQRDIPKTTMLIEEHIRKTTENVRGWLTSQKD